MRLARVTLGAEPVAAVVDADDRCHLLAPTLSADPLLDLLRDGRGLFEAARALTTGDTVDLAEVRLLAPLHRPGKIIAIGLNYPDHTAETGMAPPSSPLTFAKYPTSVSGPADDIVVPAALTSQVDYEAELAVVIGRRCGPEGHASRGDVAAYTVANDVSARDVQFADQQWTRGKSFDTFTPMGPWLVTADEVADPQALDIWTTLSGRRVQDDNTASMVFDIDAVLAHVSAGTTLEPGDVILTGTPSGAGAFLTPPRFLADGDVVEVGIESLGQLRNTVRLRD